MSGSKPFGAAEDYPERSPAAGKPILVYDRLTPVKFTDLLDVISSYTGHAGKFIVVNATEDALTVSTASTITDAIAAVVATVAGITALLEADPLQFGADIDMEQYELKGLRLEQLAVDPVAPVNGQLWYNTATGIAKMYQNNAVREFYSAEDAIKLAAIEVTANAAAIDATQSLADIANITDDALLSKNEKPSVKKEYDEIIAEQFGIDAEATRYAVTTQKTTYDDAITALTSYITGLDPAYDDYTENTTIVRATFITKFNDVYLAKQALINKIHSNTSTLLTTTDSNADAALVAANEAAADSVLALAAVTSISSDSVLSMAEKNDIILEYSIILTEQTGIDAEATRYGITTAKTNYDSAVTALTVYLEALSPAWNDNTQDTIIVRNDFNTAFSNVYTTQQILLNKIYESAKGLADDAQADATQALSDASDAQAAANAAVITANNAEIDATAAIADLLNISSDSVISKGAEKSSALKEYNEILAKQIVYDAQAVIYSISSDDYDDAVTALTAYLGTLTSDFMDVTLNTTCVRSEFNDAFKLVYEEEIKLANLIVDSAKDIAIADAATAADAAHDARTQLFIDGGFVSGSRFEVGDGAYGANNAGMTGIVSASPATDIRFWAGSTAANKATAPFRVQHDGTTYMSKAVIAGGWTVDTEAIYYGTKKITDGYSTDGITLANDGSIHAKNFYINANGDVGFVSINSIFNATPVTSGSFRGAVKIEGTDIWEDTEDNDTYGVIRINYNGYDGGTTRKRMTIIGGGLGASILVVAPDNVAGTQYGLHMRKGAIGLTRYVNTTARDADITIPVAGMLCYLESTSKAQVYTTSWVDLH